MSEAGPSASERSRRGAGVRFGEDVIPVEAD